MLCDKEQNIQESGPTVVTIPSMYKGQRRHQPRRALQRSAEPVWEPGQEDYGRWQSCQPTAALASEHR